MPLPASAKPRIVIVDDHELFAEGVRRILVPSFSEVEVVQRASAVFTTLQTHRADIVLLDISMPGTNGIETARQILDRYPETRIIFLTMHTEPIYVRHAMGTGAHGYVLKASLVSELIKAIRVVSAGGIFISPSVENINAPETENEGGRGTASLSPKQLEVLRLVSQGKSAKEIAEFLNISAKTVEFHKTRIRQRLGLYSTAELTRFAVENHL